MSLTFGAFNAQAADDNKYPAANFKPTVVFIDNDLAKQYIPKPKAPRETTPFDSKYPAASFTPKVIYP